MTTATAVYQTEVVGRARELNQGLDRISILLRPYSQDHLDLARRISALTTGLYDAIGASLDTLHTDLAGFATIPKTSIAIAGEHLLASHRVFEDRRGEWQRKTGYPPLSYLNRSDKLVSDTLLAVGYKLGAAIKRHYSFHHIHAIARDITKPFWDGKKVSVTDDTFIPLMLQGYHLLSEADERLQAHLAHEHTETIATDAIVAAAGKRLGTAIDRIFQEFHRRNGNKLREEIESIDRKIDTNLERLGHPQYLMHGFPEPGVGDELVAFWLRLITTRQLLDCYRKGEQSSERYATIIEKGDRALDRHAQTGIAAGLLAGLQETGKEIDAMIAHDRGHIDDIITYGTGQLDIGKRLEQAEETVRYFARQERQDRLAVPRPFFRTIKRLYDGVQARFGPWKELHHLKTDLYVMDEMLHSEDKDITVNFKNASSVEYFTALLGNARHRITRHLRRESAGNPPSYLSREAIGALSRKLSRIGSDFRKGLADAEGRSLPEWIEGLPMTQQRKSRRRRRTPEIEDKTKKRGWWKYAAVAAGALGIGLLATWYSMKPVTVPQQEPATAPAASKSADVERHWLASMVGETFTAEMTPADRNFTLFARRIGIPRDLEQRFVLDLQKRNGWKAIPGKNDWCSGIEGRVVGTREDPRSDGAIDDIGIVPADRKVFLPQGYWRLYDYSAVTSTLTIR